MKLPAATPTSSPKANTNWVWVCARLASTRPPRRRSSRLRASCRAAPPGPSDLVAFFPQRLLDPAAVDGAGVDLLHRRSFLLEDRLGRCEDALGLLLRHCHQPVGIADDDVTGHDRHAGDRDGHVDLAGPVLVRPA